MPSQKSRAQAAALKKASLSSPKSPPACISGTSLVSGEFDILKKQPQPQPSAETGENQARRRTFAEVVAESTQVLRRNPSQKSVSTDTGSSSSACSNHSPFHSEGRTEQLHSSQPRLDLPARICSPHAPLWVDNGSKGDKAAWLLVLPKFEQLSADSTKSGLVDTLNSPSDALLLGPYVTTKNTFLDESRVNQSLMFSQRFRAKSWDAGRSCMRAR